MMILLVDDSPVIRDASPAILARPGRTDGDGREALAMPVEAGPDPVVDWNTPRTGGPTFVRGLRRVDRDTPVIMAAAELERRKVIDAARAGVVDGVVKPRMPELLAERTAPAKKDRAA